jgi:hypothetical protein
VGITIAFSSFALAKKSKGGQICNYKNKKKSILKEHMPLAHVGAATPPPYKGEGQQPTAATFARG